MSSTEKLTEVLKEREKEQKADSNFAGTKKGYLGCKRCESTASPEEIAIFGLFVQNDKACDPQQISNLHYIAPIDQPCGPSEAQCVADEAAMLKVSPNECLDRGYQNRKKMYSEALLACGALQTALGVTNVEDIPPYSQQCPMYAFDHFKCRSSDKKCRYKPSGCTNCTGNPNDFDFVSTCDCSGVDESIIRACANSFEGCEDPEYVLDARTAANFTTRCAEEYSSYQNLDKWGTWGSLAAYALLLFLIVFLFLRGGRRAEADMGRYGTGGPITEATLRQQGLLRPGERLQYVTSGSASGLALVRSPITFGLMAFCLLAVSMVGYLIFAMAEERPPFASGEFKKNNFDTFNDEVGRTLGLGLVGLGIIPTVGLFIYRRSLLAKLKSH